METNRIRSERYRWILLGILFVTYFLEQGSRQIYNAALPQIKLDFAALGVTDTQLGLVGTVFSAVFGLSLVGSGLASDFFGRKRVLVLGTLLFSLGVFVSGFAAGIGLLMVAYGVFNAVGQCCVAPPCYSLIAQHHGRTRSVAMAVFQAAVYLGVILSSVFAGCLSESGAGGWRLAFWIAGGVGILWAFVMQCGVDDGDAGQPEQAERPSLKAAFNALLGKPTAMLIAAAFGMFIYANLGIRLWTPMFMVRHFEGVGVAKAALHAVVWLNAGAILSSLVAARVIDRLAPRWPRVRLDASAVGFVLCAAPVVLVARSTTFAGCCAALFALGLTVGVYEAAHYPAMFDCVPARYRSATTGLTGCYAFVFGSFAPAVLGWMGGTFSMRTAFASLGAFYLLGAAILVPAIVRYFKADYIQQVQGRELQ